MNSGMERSTSKRYSSQSVEESGCALGGDRVSGIFRAEPAEKEDLEKGVPLPLKWTGELFCCQISLS